MLFHDQVSFCPQLLHLNSDSNAGQCPGVLIVAALRLHLDVQTLANLDVVASLC